MPRELDTVLVYGSFKVPGYDTNFIVLSYSSGRVPWAKEIFPAVARLVQPWMPKVESSRIVRQKKAPNGTLTWREPVFKMPSLHKVMCEIHIDGSCGPGLRSTTKTKRYVWDKELKEDKP